MPTTTWIPSGEMRIFDVGLPKCDVMSDPCTERVAIKLSLSVRNGKGYAITTNENSYTFDPDPTATFRIDGLRDNRPLFLTQGESRDAVPEDRSRLEFRFVGPAPADIEKVVNRIVSYHGLKLVEEGTEGDVQFFELAYGEQGLQAPTSTAIDAVIDDIRHEYGSGVELTSKSFVPDTNFGFDDVFSAARDAARVVAEQLANFTGSVPLSYASGLSGDGTMVQLNPRSDDGDPNAPFISSEKLIFDPSALKLEESSSPTLLDVRVRDTDGALGARATLGSPAGFSIPSRTSQFLGDGLADVQPLPVDATIAADRPQVFALAATTRQWSESSGYRQDVVALVLARDRARTLASQLGVATGTVSLIAQYQPLKWSETRTLITFGAAMTMVGETAATWRELAVPTLTPTPAMAARTPYPMPRPVPTKVASRFGARGNPTPRPDMVPLEAPDALTTLTALGDVQTSARADGLRVSIAFDRGDRTPDDNKLKGLPNTAMIEQLIRAQPGVQDVAVETVGYASLPVGYQIVLSTRDAGRVQGLISTIRARYAPFHVTTKYDASLVLSDCEEVVVQAQGASAAQAARSAVNAASESGRRLRKLLLAAAYLPETGDYCLRQAEPDATDRARDDALHIPGDPTVRLSVPVKLTFRTYTTSKP